MNAQTGSQHRALVSACKRVPNLIVFVREAKFSVQRCFRLLVLYNASSRTRFGCFYRTEPSGGVPRGASLLREQRCKGLEGRPGSAWSGAALCAR